MTSVINPTDPYERAAYEAYFEASSRCIRTPDNGCLHGCNEVALYQTKNAGIEVRARPCRVFIEIMRSRISLGRPK